MPSCRIFWKPVRYPADEALKNLLRSGRRNRQKISILVELTVCQKNVENAFNSVGIVLKNKV